ncbi:MAG: TIR domain-containing protein, partial [Anaerolineae bacterium]|nr:TIR domain-containing protein [Anaerolineae bacterium]
MTTKQHIFISYSRADKATVQRLIADLQDAGIKVWLDTQDLKPGTHNWEEALRSAIASAYAVLLIASPSSRRSPYVQDELAIARMFDCPIYPIWAAGDEWIDSIPMGMGKMQYIDARVAQYVTALPVIIDTVRTGRPSEAATEDTASKLGVTPGYVPQNPYKGLEAFTEADADRFFGRETFINKLIEALDKQLRDDSNRLMAIVGASGSGKSSVVMAGLLPRLRDDAIPGSTDWKYLPRLLPGARPIESLANTLYQELPTKTISAIEEDLWNTSGKGLHRIATQLTGLGSRSRVVLYIDQFEELFTQTVDERERKQFIDLIVTAATEPNGVMLIILTMRADFYDRPLNYAGLGALMEQTQPVLPMSLADLHDAVQRPADKVGLKFDDELVASLVFDVRDQLGGLPLLQFTLDRLYEMRDGRKLTIQAYRKIGGVRGALADHAEATYNRLTSDQHKRMARALFLRLIEPGATEQDTTRRRAALSELVLPDPEESAILREVADKFVRARLLVTNKVAGQDTIEVGHEALIREWDTLAAWLHDAREDVRLQKAIAADAVEWVRRSKPVDMLYRGSILEDAQSWAKANAASKNEMEFIEASVAEQAAQRERDARIARRVQNFQRASVLLGVFVVVALAAALVLSSQVITAQTEIQNANAFIATAGTQVAVVGQTLTPADMTVQAGVMQISTARVEQQQALDNLATADARQATAQVAVTQAAGDAAQAREQVVIAGQTLTPIPQTLTPISSTLAAGEAQLAIAQTQIAGVEPTLAGAQTQVAGVEPTLASAGTQIAGAVTQVAESGQTLTPIPQTLTPVALTLAAGDAQLAQARQAEATAAAQANAAQQQVLESGQTLTPVALTLVAGDVQLALAQTQVAGVEPTVESAGTQVAAAIIQVAESGQTLTPIPQTLTPVALTLAAGDAQVAQARDSVATAAAQSAAAERQVLESGQTLTPVALTLVAGEVQLAVAQTQIAGVEPTLASASTQIAGVEPTVAGANTRVAESAQTLTPIPQTLTPVALTLAAGDAQLAEARGQIATAQGQAAGAETLAAEAALALTPVPQTLTPVALTLVAANEQVNRAGTQVAGVEPTLFSAETQVAGVEPTLIAARTQVAGVQPTVARAETQVAEVLPTLAYVEQRVQEQADLADSFRLSVAGQNLLSVGNPDLAIALMLEAYRLNPFLVETQRVLNSAIPLTVRLSLDGATRPVNAFSPDSRFYVTTEDGRNVVVWDVDNRTRLQEFSSEQSITTLVFSPNGRFLIGGTARGEIRVWDFEAGTQRFNLRSHRDSILALAVSPDNNFLLSGGMDYKGVLWDLNSGSPVAEFIEHEAPVSFVAFNANTTRAFTYDFGRETVRQRFIPRITIYDMVTRTDFIQTPEIYRGLSPNGQYSYTGGDGSDFLTLWNPAQLVPERIFRLGNANEDYINQIAFSSDYQRLLVHVETRAYGANQTYVVTDRYVAIWEIATGAELLRLQVSEENPRNWDVSSVSFSEDGRLAATGGRYGSIFTVTLWDTATGEELRRFTGHTSPIERVGFSADGRHLFSFSAGNARVWDIVTDINQPRRVDLRVDNFSRFGLSADGQNVYVAYNEQSLSTWDTQTGTERQGLDFFTGQQNVIAFSPTQPLALVNGPEGTILWDLAREERVTRLDGIDNVTDIVFSSDGRDAALATNNGVLIWNVESQGSSVRWSVSGVNHLALYFNQLIAASQPDRIVTYDAIARSTLDELTGFSGQVNAIAFSPAGDRVIAAVGEPDNAVILWDVQTGSRIFTMVGHNDNVNTVAFSPDGKTAISGSDDTTLILWDVETGQSVTRLRGHTAPVRRVMFSPDGRSVLSSSDNVEEDILIWPIGTVQDTVNWVYANRYVLPLDCD